VNWSPHVSRWIATHSSYSDSVATRRTVTDSALAPLGERTLGVG